MRIFVSLFHYYSGDVYHNYQASLYYAKKFGDGVLTCQNYVERPFEYAKATLDLYGSIEITEEEKASIPIFYVPQHILDSLWKNASWSNIKSAEFMQELPEYQKALKEQIDTVLGQRKDRVESFIVFGQPPRYISLLAESYHAKIISYEFSTIRVSSEYSMNLMFAMKENLYATTECEERYKNFQNDPPHYLFSREELLALFANQQLLPLIPMVAREGQYEFGHVLGGDYYWNIYSLEKYTDADIYREVSGVWAPNQILYRRHPAYLALRTPVDELAPSESPVEFILKCRRVGAAFSNMLFEAMLWGRTAYTNGNLFCASFACEKDPASQKIASISFLNFYLFSFLVPQIDNLFDPSYWDMRKGVKEKEIFAMNQEIVLRKLGIPLNVLYMNKKKRFHTILSYRKFDRSLINRLSAAYDDMPFDVCYEVMCSVIGIFRKSENNQSRFTCLNRMTDSIIQSSFQVELYKGDYFWFSPLGNRVGYVKIIDVLYNNKTVYESENEAGSCTVLGCIKNKKRFFPPWDIISVNFHQKHTISGDITVLWKYYNMSIENLKDVAEKTNTN